MNLKLLHKTLLPGVTSSQAEGAAGLSTAMSSFCHPSAAMGYLLMHENSFDTTKCVYHCSQGTSMVARGIKRKQGTKHQTLSQQKSSAAKSETKRDDVHLFGWTMLYMLFNSSLFILQCYSQGNGSTKQNPLPACLNMQCLMCLRNTHIT